ncbi:MAG: hypothetical protein GY821_00205 [Gammaproteobacteria bacterium]|nr:hypothetical protein [Gammaproteobacteria bacterium]
MHHNNRKDSLYTHSNSQSIVPKLSRKEVKKNLGKVIEHSNKLAEKFKSLYSQKKEKKMQKLKDKIIVKRQEVQQEKDKIIKDEVTCIIKTYTAKKRLYEEYGESLRDGSEENKEYNELRINAENKAYQALRDYRQKTIDLERWVQQNEEQCIAPLRSYTKKFLDRYKQQVTQDKQAIISLISQGKYEAAQSKIEVVEKVWDKMVEQASAKMLVSASGNKRKHDNSDNDAVYTPPAKRQKLMNGANRPEKLSNVKRGPVLSRNDCTNSNH